MEAAGRHAALSVGQGYARSHHLLGLLSDERLVARTRLGSERAFAVLYERHYRNVLSFCRHMLGSREDAEDVVQQTFVNAYRDILRQDRELRFRPWLYRIARNLCISTLRARRPAVELSEEHSFVGLSDEIVARSELRQLLHDLAQLPSEQREALLLAELHDNSHADVAAILGCESERVKSLVFQARSSLMKSREAHEISCEEIRRQLSVLRGGALRRSVISRHLKACEGCRAFKREVKRQRQALAVVLPVVPSASLKFGAASAIAAAGVKAGSGGAAAGGSTLAAKLGASTLLAKGVATTAAVTVIAGGGAVALEATSGPSEQQPAGLERSLGEGNRAGSAKPGGPAGLAVGAPIAHGQDRRGARRGRSAGRRSKELRGAHPAARGRDKAKVNRARLERAKSESHRLRARRGRPTTRDKRRAQQQGTHSRPDAGGRPVDRGAPPPVKTAPPLDPLAGTGTTFPAE